MNNLKLLLKTMRPKQWTKNVFVFAALAFDEKILNLHYLNCTVVGFILFCLVSGVVYTINDLADIEKDRLHPTKRHRPLPSGELSPRFALTAAIIIGTGALIGAMLLNPALAMILAGYLVLQIGYSFYLKHIVLLDVMAIAAGFVLRVGAGVPLVNAERFSPWLYICTTLLALFLGLGKRRGELVLLKEEAVNHRAILASYTVPLLDHLISSITASTILAYALYTFSATNLPKNNLMMLTIPFVIYGLFRYLYLIHVEGSTLAPDEVLLKDRAMQVDIVLWGLSAVGILYFG
ncbi:MAG: decaprenyl-phosphate phosphoribosyltransferase [Anaerolineales bacterium]